jgi:hypothetical protein
MNMAKAPDTDTISSSEVNAGHLLAFIERIERLEEEKKASRMFTARPRRTASM